ncbi:MAG: mannose-6-phosphate isomerase, class I [Chitinophagaceae bacterium]|nr:mannose-6-phosphate isomerase, class I [Chitinophagaceae bacterium]
MKGIAGLTGTVKHYDWGGTHLIPSLLQVDNKEQQPFAEYWLGVHPLADGIVEDGTGGTAILKDIISNNKEQTLGERVNKQFGNLPYLLKAMDVKDMLSIQVHPSKKAAEEEFAKENAAGIPLTAGNRNYKDNNHKPELAMALSDFWLLHGFKSEVELLKIFEQVKELGGLKALFQLGGYEALYSKVMTMPQEEVDKLLSPLVSRIIPLYKEGKLDRSKEDFWAARAALTYSQNNHIDRGIFSVYFFNVLHLKKGQAIFQDAGIPHAYLEGPNVEIMANSDNVLRGGLTTKHIDVKELLKHVKCEATKYEILKGEWHGLERIYPTKAPDFQLSSFELDPGEKANFTAGTTEILLLTEGEVTLTNGTDSIRLLLGKPSAVVFAGQKVQLEAHTKSAVYRATVPVHNGE